MKLTLALTLLAAGVYSCSARRLPPEMPPPEYEPPIVTPWISDSLDPGAAPVGDALNTLDAGARPGGELSPDAGVR